MKSLKIKKYYAEFKNFIQPTYELPKICPTQKDETRDTYAYIKLKDIGNKKVNLYYDKKLFLYKEEFIRSILFHEFTHIFDGAYFNGIFDDKQFDDIMSIYSEYHASQVEVASNIGWSDFNSNDKIDLSNTFAYIENDKINIEDYYLIPLADVLKIIEKPHNEYYNLPCEEYYKIYKKFQSKMIYYLGKKNFCINHSKIKQPDLTQKVMGEFYSITHEIEINIEDKNFDILPKLKHDLLIKFLSIFKLKEERLLLEILNN